MLPSPPLPSPPPTGVTRMVRSTTTSSHYSSLEVCRPESWPTPTWSALLEGTMQIQGRRSESVPGSAPRSHTLSCKYHTVSLCCRLTAMQQLVCDTSQKRLVPSVASHYFHTHPSKGTLITNMSIIAAHTWCAGTHEDSAHPTTPRRSYVEYCEKGLHSSSPDVTNSDSVHACLVQRHGFGHMIV